jgi:hypothetical protein
MSRLTRTVSLLAAASLLCAACSTGGTGGAGTGASAKPAASSAASASASPTTTKPAVKLMGCTATTATKPTPLADWKTRLYAAPLVEKSTNTDVPDSKVRTFSIAQMTTKQGSSLYYRVERTDGGYMSTTRQVLEVCNADNKSPQHWTTASDTDDWTGKNVVARISALYPLAGRLTPGAYRVDAYFFVGGHWYLTNRITGVQLTS